MVVTGYLAPPSTCTRKLGLQNGNPLSKKKILVQTISPEKSGLTFPKRGVGCSQDRWQRRWGNPLSSPYAKDNTVHGQSP